MTTHSSPEAPHTALSTGLVWLMAAASGATVANLYYNQPLLGDIGEALGASGSALGLVPMLTQVGYAVGMLFIVPLGDSLERRRVIVTMNMLVALALVGVALAPTLHWMVAASFVVGVTTIIPQLLVPFAAHLAPAAQRGRVVGTVMSGVLIGILLSRTAAGFIGTHLGWRTMFWIAAGLMLALAGVLRFTLPSQPPMASMPYPQLLRSLIHLARTEPVLRLHAVLGALSFGAFSVFWSTLALYLQSLPQKYDAQVAGLFGVVGVAGAAVAPLVGRYADKRGDRRINGAAIVVLLLSFVVMWPLGRWLWGMALGVVLLDLGVQANQISNQTRVYSLRPEARSRLNTLYMVTYFAGGAAGSWLGTFAWTHWGWSGVCASGAALCVVALLALKRGPKGGAAKA
ncbi:major facilitator family transporter [Myxococcus xanthus DK 1622]|uniref:Major facilitator family transporter n=1 Tax=Myxococcus xanthus (strain DK1622) TaxID=246197 RepID=Q1DG53_MYXXD|nr:MULTISPECIES: MFS transporter [Myxococcus]ABF90296.1 major facilitator family transporter [Myxococcus xanthus DK 1622]NOJ54285.1 MFS transporter [Myxococcus xanthus]QPM79824.1 MFS transporter [Myxococcus xanthus]QVW68888.1 MFS transporter [Myxococcus xanthus DZ2]QZZ47648.1 putative transporter [Myxococcus xanthus]